MKILYGNNLLLFFQKWFTVKVQASGWPKHVKTDQQKDIYIAVNESKRIHLDRAELDKGVNVGLRTIAKRMLNSLWGKFAQRSNLPKVKIFSDPLQMEKFLADSRFELLGVTFLTPNRLLVNYKYAKDEDAGPGRTSTAIAAMVTSYARIHLYRLMARVGLEGEYNRSNGLLYYVDTDSLIFKTDAKHPNPFKHGSELGELTSEIFEKTGDENARIVRLACLCPKTYAYMIETTNKTTHEKEYLFELKCKGVSLSRATSDVMSFQSFWDKTVKYLDNAATDLEPLVAKQNSFIVGKNDGDRFVHTSITQKIVMITHGKRMLFLNSKDPHNGMTFEFGYRGHEDESRGYRDNEATDMPRITKQEKKLLRNIDRERLLGNPGVLQAKKIAISKADLRRRNYLMNKAENFDFNHDIDELRIENKQIELEDEYRQKEAEENHLKKEREKIHLEHDVVIEIPAEDTERAKKTWDREQVLGMLKPADDFFISENDLAEAGPCTMDSDLSDDTMSRIREQEKAAYEERVRERVNLIKAQKKTKRPKRNVAVPMHRLTEPEPRDFSKDAGENFYRD